MVNEYENSTADGSDGVMGGRMNKIRQMHHEVMVNKSEVVKLKVMLVFIKAKTMDLMIKIVTFKEISTMIVTRIKKQTMKRTPKRIVLWPKPFR